MYGTFLSSARFQESGFAWGFPQMESGPTGCPDILILSYYAKVNI
jgi:hypothetical protein